MKELSIFVDESGDFGEYAKHSPYYIVSMIIHDQSADISEQIKKLDNELAKLGLLDHVVHTEPLIRKEGDYHPLSLDERRTVFTKLFYFAIHCDIRYKAFLFYKKDYDSIDQFKEKMTIELKQFIRDNLLIFQSYDRVVLYYDNGQYQLTKILNNVLSTELSYYEAKKAIPSEYKLFQVADLICTLRLLEEKSSNKALTHSEKLVFYGPTELKKAFIKPIKKKEWIKK